MPVHDGYQEQVQVKIKKPSQYQVILFNDDFTPMDFVVDILVEIFQKSKEEAFTVMYAVHYNGSAAAGIYVYDIANTKAEETMKKARENGYPLRVGVEEV